MRYAEAFGFIIDTVGKLLVAYTTLMVHHRVANEHKIDGKVFQVMKRERLYGFIGMGMIIVGSLIELAAKVGFI